MGYLAGHSRSFFQKLITGGFVRVNGAVVSKSRVLRAGDDVTVLFPAPEPIVQGPVDVDFSVFDAQQDFLVINKPAGLTVHCTKDPTEATLVNGLLYRFKEFSEFGETERPGIVHRLDKYTSGLLLVARNERAQRDISHMFKERAIEKTYLAVVKGHPDKEGKIDLPVGRHPVDRSKMSHVSYTGKPALTYYQVLRYYKETSLVAVRIITGRTHQIRVHMAAIGHGIVGDNVYGVASKYIKRQALHAWKLAFMYNGTRYAYTCPVPNDFVKLFKHFKSF